jgi:hypothetical protein
MWMKILENYPFLVLFTVFLVHLNLFTIKLNCISKREFHQRDLKVLSKGILSRVDIYRPEKFMSQ